MPRTIMTIGQYIENASLHAAEFVGNTLVRLGAPTGIASRVATASLYAFDALIYAAPSLILSATRPGPPGPQELRVPVKQSRPVRQTGTGRDRISGPVFFS